MADPTNLKNTIAALEASETTWGNYLMLIIIITGLGALTQICINVRQWFTHSKIAQLRKLAETEERKEELAREEQIACLQNETQKAKDQIAQAEKQTAETLFRMERLKKAVAWRELSTEQQNFFIQIISTDTHSILIGYTSFDPEALRFASQLKSVFERAKWRACVLGFSYPDKILYDVILPDGQGNEQHEGARLSLMKALKRAKIQTNSNSIPQPQVTYGPVTSCELLLFVGSKRPMP